MEDEFVATSKSHQDQLCEMQLKSENPKDERSRLSLFNEMLCVGGLSGRGPE